MQKFAADELIDSIQLRNGRILEEGERDEVEQYLRGRELQSVVNTEGYAIILDTIKNYADKAVEGLLSLPPGDPSVTTAHAAASALVQTSRFIEQDIHTAVEASMGTPECMRDAMRTIAPEQ